MNVNIIATGQAREKYLRAGTEEFDKRLSRYCKLVVKSIKDERAPERLSQREKDMVKSREGERLIQKIPRGSYVIALAIEGKQLSSEEMAGKIQNLMVEGINDITFVIGGSLGLSEEVMRRSDFSLSFSKMTFPHQLMRLILLEQIYRSFKIISGETYHK